MDVLKDILDKLTDSLIIIDPYGQIVLFNAEAVRVQRSISETPLVIGEFFNDIVTEERKPVVTEILKTIRRQKKPVKNFAEYNTQFGTNVFLEINFVPVLGAKKKVRYINVITQDITSRKIFEKKLKTATADLTNLLEHAHAVIFSIDSRGYIVGWNNHCTELTGYSKEEVLSQKFPEVLLRKSNIPLFTGLMERVTSNEAVGNFQLPIKKKGSGEIIVMLSATPRTNSNGQVIGATMVGQDVTELMVYRKSLEKQVQNKTAALEQVMKNEKEAVELKSRFVSIASHEFRSPLSSIDYAASFIKQNAATIGRKKLNEKVEVIEKHVSFMSHMLEDVLNYSKNEAGKIRIIPSTVCLETFVKDAVEEVMCHCKHSHHICVSTNKLGTLVTDEKLLRNILNNLLNNAVKFSPGREEISLYVQAEEDFITLEVSDEGMGIPEDELEKIFHPFVRGKAVENIQGTGLGLSIVKKAVELLRGTIKVKSTPGKGSVFKVTIPRCAL